MLIRLIAPTVSAILLSACSSADEVEEQLLPQAQASAASGQADETQSEAAPSFSKDVKGSARSVSVENDSYQFEYSYPAAVGAQPQLKALFDAKLDEAQAKLAESVAEAAADAKEYDYPFRPHSLSVGWQVVADLPDWLSLSEAIWTYTGGAHGNSVTGDLVWDKQAQKALTAVELFTSPAALQEAVSARYCAALNQERRERRGGDYNDDGIFSACPGVEELTVLAGSSNGATFNRLGFIADPYVAGSYAEGPYEVTLPVDDAVIAALKPQYRAAFSVGS